MVTGDVLMILLNLRIQLCSTTSYLTCDHDIERFGDKLNNFHMGIVKEVPARLLDRVEDFFIYSTRAVTESLNRIKVSR